MKTFIYLKQFVFDLNKTMFHSCPNVAGFDKKYFVLERRDTLHNNIRKMRWHV